MVIALLCVCVSGVMAFLGAVTDVIRQQYSIESLVGWNILFYVLAGVVALIAVIEFIRSIIRLHRRRQRDEFDDDLPRINIGGFTINGAYSGGNGKKNGKSTGKTGKIPRK